MTKVDKGWIKIHRKIMDWDWYNDDVTKAIYLHLLLTVNYEKKSWRGITIEPGERVISINGLAEETQHSKQQTRTALEKLKATQEITLTPTHKYTIVKVLNYRLYQGLDESEQHSNQHTEQHSSNTVATRNATHSATTTKEIKNKELKNKEKDIKDIYGEYQHVLLTDKERDRLFKDYGELETMDAIKYLDEYLESHQKKIKEYTNHNLVLRNWVFNAVKEQKQREERANGRTKNKEEDFFSGLMGFFENNKDEIMGGD